MQNTCKAEYPAVWHQEGGKKFDSALKNGGSGNPKYLIRPDKTFKKSPTASEINNAAGNEQHDCQTPVTNVSNAFVDKNADLYNVNRKGFTIINREAGDVAISFYSSNGQLKKSFSISNILAGTRTFNWETAALANGIYIAHMYINNTQTTKKVVIK